jgi:ribosomal protein S21
VSLEISLREGESQESSLHHFQRMVQMSGALREVKANRHYVPKSEAARIKAKKSPSEAATGLIGGTGNKYNIKGGKL